MRKYIIAILFLFLANNSWSQDAFTQKDRNMLIELRIKVYEIDKRFEQIDKRFEQLDKRFEQLDKRFEQIDKRFEQIMSFLWILSGIFTSLTIGVIGFAYWDRRTIIHAAEKETIKTLKQETKIDLIIPILREIAKKNKQVAAVLKQFNLM